MPAIRRTLLALLALPLCALAADKGIEHVWPEYHQAEYFERLGEYFGGTESHPGRRVLRTQEGSREGYYFLIRLKDKTLATHGAKWKLEVIRPGQHQAETYEFALPEGKPEPVFELGLTGKDWKDAKAHPVAWRITLLAPEGQELAASQSLLWE